MKIVQPIVKINENCTCSEEMLRFQMDAYGVTDIICVDHGPIQIITQQIFDSKEELDDWLKRQNAIK